MIDRLIRPSMARAALRHSGIDSTDVWRSATPEQRAQLESDRRALIDRAIREDQTDVIAGLRSATAPMIPTASGAAVTIDGLMIAERR